MLGAVFSVPKPDAFAGVVVAEGVRDNERPPAENHEDK